MTEASSLGDIHRWKTQEKGLIVTGKGDELGSGQSYIAGSS